jgi:MFS family permease
MALGTGDDGEIERTRRALAWDGAWANVVGVLTGGVLLVGFALALGAGPLTIGVLAAVPFFAQLAQLPAIRLVERVRHRRWIAVAANTGARALILAMAAIPFVGRGAIGLALLFAGVVATAVLGAVAVCAWNSWMHDLLPKEQLGRFFAHRLFWATAFALVAGPAGGFVVDHWTSGTRPTAYAALFAAAGLAGFVSSYWLSRVPDVPMRVPLEPRPWAISLVLPLRDRRFRPLLLFSAIWNFASNLSAPFFAVYFMQQLGLSLVVVVVLWALSQLANMLTLRMWGRLADRLSPRALLAVGVPIYLGAVLALPFAALPAPHPLTVPVLAVIHLVMGAATAAIGLGSANIGLTMAPKRHATEYLATIGLVGSVAAGMAPIIGGALASLLAHQDVSVLVHWGASAGGRDMVALRFRHWEFLFALTFVIGLGAVYALSQVRQGAEVSEREVIEHIVIEAQRTMRSLSSVSGLRGAALFPFGGVGSDRPREGRR